MTKKKIGIFVPLTLGTLAAFGPLVTDVYLPAMPEMTAFFHTSPSVMALSMTAGMIGLAVGQLFIGPLSDKYGRKPMMMLSMALFVVSTLLCIYAPNVHGFNMMRVLQGFAGAGGVALSKSVSTDMFTGKDLAKFMALLAAINGISPVVGPMVGGAMASFASWQYIFWLLLAIGIVLFFCCGRLRETLSPEHRSKQNMLQVYANLFRVFSNRRFTLSTLAMMSCFFTFFAYVAASPFIFQQVYGLTPMEFSLCFGLNALMVGVGAAVGPHFHHQNTSLKWGSIGLAVSAVLVTVCQILHLPLPVLVLCYVYMLTSFGLMQPGCTAIAMDSQRERAGAASAVFGAFGFVAGAVASPLVSLGNIMWTSALVMLAGAFFCLVMTLPLCAAVKQEGMERAA